MKTYIGVTERGDGGIDFSWVDKLNTVNAVICISKAANSDLVSTLICHRDKVIYHATCTGMGHTVIEPNVPSMEDKLAHVEELIEKGFPASHIVMRIDPIIPIKTGNLLLGKDYLSQIETILKFCVKHDLRVRYSYLDMYPHVMDRFAAKGVPVTKFSKEDMDAVQNLFSKYPSLKYMSCGERWTPENHKVGCVSEEDFRILGLDVSQCVLSSWRQRKTCLCCSAKKELLTQRKPCPHGCLYCYWKDKD